MRRACTVPIAALVACGLVLAGLCTVAAASPAKKPPTKKEYIKKGDAICRKLNDDTQALASQHGLDTTQNPTPDQINAFVKDVVPAIRDALDELRALKPPKGDAKKLRKIFAAVDKAVDRVERDPQSLLNQNENAFAEADRLTRRYGFKVCGQGSSA